MDQRETNTKDHIRETAMELFKKRGFEHVTVMDICQASDVTKRTFYYHFETKAEILSDIIDYWGVKAERLMSSFINEERNIDILWSLMLVYCSHSQNCGPNIMKQVYITMLEKGKDIRFPYKMYLYDLAVQLLRKAQNAGEIMNQRDPEDVIYILYHAFRSISISWAAENAPYDLVEEFRKSFDIIVGNPQ